MKVGIIGAGIVGGAIEHWFAEAHELFVHDPVRGTTLTDVTAVYYTHLTLPTILRGYSSPAGRLITKISQL